MSQHETDPPSSPAPEAAPGSAGCPSCGAAAQPGQRYCGQCGALLARVCEACGAANPAGHRFCGQCGASLQAAGTPPAVAEKKPSVSTPRDEWRWATVLFADISDFTAMAERMDAEDAKALAQRCVERLGEQVRRFEGTVIHVPGDQVVAVFGAPVAHEDDAERAVRAGLAMRDCPLSDDDAHPIQLHVGINTGEVMAGLFGPQEHRDYTVMGDTVNTAARLMSAAPAGSVLVGEETYRATRLGVHYRELPPVAVKGKERPIPVWEALEVAAVPAARLLGTAPLVGRDRELALLSDLWLKVVRDARPHLVTVLGEPGIGKSRLVAEFEGRHLGGAAVIHGRCLPYGEALGYWALAMALKEAAGITGEDDGDMARRRLGDLVRRAMEPDGGEGNPEEVAQHLALLSGLDTAADGAAGPGDQRTLHASVRRFLEALARRQPLCVMVEDIHWAQERSDAGGALLDLIELVAARAEAAPLMIVAQARPELLEKRPAWGRGLTTSTPVPLEPLDEEAGRALIQALCRERGLEDEVAGQVGRGAGGNPLFAEELVAMIAERGGPAGIPTVIKALISARLDVLPPEQRRALQNAAVIGKVFWTGGLQALGAPGQVMQSLELLVEKDLLRAVPRSQFRGEPEYAFKHDLIRDVAYETLPRAERRALHGRVTDWIEQVAGDQGEDYVDLLAHHAVQADQPERALGYLQRAAERARRAVAHREEAALLAQAIGIAERLGQGERVAELRAQRGIAFNHVPLWAEARQELEAALNTLPPEHLGQRITVMVEVAKACHWLGDVPSTRRYADEAFALADSAHRDDLAVAAMSAMGLADSSSGELQASLDRYERASERAGERDRSSLVTGTEMSSLILYWLGRFEASIARGHEALRIAREMSDTTHIVRALGNLGLALMASGRYIEALEMFGEARRFGQRHGIGAWLARAISMQGGMHLELGDFAAAEALAEEAREMGRSANFRHAIVSPGIDLLLSFARRQEVGRAEKLLGEVAEAAQAALGAHGWVWQLRMAQVRAEIALARGDWEEALRWAEEATERGRARGRVKYQVLGLGARGKALAALGRQQEAIADLRQGVEMARPVGDPAMLLRAATALLAVEGDEAVAAEARGAAERIAAALPDAEMRRRFEATDPVRRLLR